ncbi:MAG: SDR family NAD(P)-dependent oxidoreductase, partial [Nitrospinaceae bacterium]|nr:SDR family NAD(P)-dependent oxidoreductase [Nitrospinaceae bacterium]
MPEKKLAGKRAIVTGASSGMGASMARHIAAAGANVWAVGGGNDEALKETITDCTASGSKASGKGYDFSDARQAGVAVKEGADFLGVLDAAERPQLGAVALLATALAGPTTGGE